MHKGFDIQQLRASEEWYVFIGHEYINIGPFASYIVFMTYPVGRISVNVFLVYHGNGIVMKIKLGISLVYGFDVFE